jgi:hypothetical protein
VFRHSLVVNPSAERSPQPALVKKKALLKKKRLGVSAQPLYLS